ncbi:Paraquat-inducible protein A [Granulibacter bethesdensis]|uniref:Paraquat-inducible protein A n=1 Tax=Granulibacter bethesdensis TaxID=364410 RepID=A0AAN0RBS0_9PROT|nr:paraquat-inducible protein A [Granulibacter bethesdensis]AHJ61938.1 Paraquat-inducible protein A [Granulibacter bethesdensis]
MVHAEQQDSQTDGAVDGGRSRTASSIVVHRHALECPGCGAFYRQPPRSQLEVHCTRCHTVLRRTTRSPERDTVALAGTGLALFILVGLMPYITFDMRGRENVGTMLGGALAFWEYGLWVLGLIVMFTTLIAPFLRLVGLLAAVTAPRMRKPPRELYILLRVAQWVRPWSMIEVFMLGMLVAYSRLEALAHVRFGVALYALGGLMLVMAAMDWALDPRDAWNKLEARGLVADPVMMGEARRNAATRRFDERHAISCHGCGLVVEGADHDASCPRCGSFLHRRKPDSVTRTIALVVAAVLLYIPANIYPVMIITSLGDTSPHTIVGGVKELIEADMWPLAALVFFASVMVPVLKVIGLVWMILRVRRPSMEGLKTRTRIFHVIEMIGRWSMIDVFVVTILIALVHMGFIATIQPGPGALAFAGVVIITMLAAETFDPRLMWDAAIERQRSTRHSRDQAAEEGPDRVGLVSSSRVSVQGGLSR